MDHEPATANTVLRILSAPPYAGWHVIAAYSVAEALRALQASPAGLIVDPCCLDPSGAVQDRSGFLVIDRARKLGFEVPILVLTASNEILDIARTYRLGAKHLCKPFDDEDIIRFAEECRQRSAPGADALLDVIVADDRLTTAQRRIARAAIVSSNYQAIAELVGRNVETVRRHLSAIRAKTGKYVDELVRPIRKATIRW